MTSRNPQDAVAVPGGGNIPLIGFGTWPLEGDDAYNCVRTALDVGYRHIDTATLYANEDRVGAAIRDSKLDRGEIFITTKCPSERVGHELETLEESLSRLDTEFVDLWLIHWPPGGDARPDTWERFIVAQQQGKARAIGVSNYTIAQVDQLIAVSGHAPALNQIPWSPFSYDPGKVRALAQRGVLLGGYSPLKGSSLGDAELARIAAAHGKTPAQVILRWHLEHGVIVIPTSARPTRIKENFDLYDFELADDEVSRLDSLAA